MAEPSTKRTLILPMLAAAVLGGGVAAGLVTLLDGDDGGGTTTTVVRQAPLAATGDAPSTGSAEPSDAGLTAADIYRRFAPGVVFIRADIVQQSDSPFGAPQQQQGEATGTGFVVDKAGDILTNNHVIDGATKVTVQFADKKTATARVVGTDPSTDVALLKVDPRPVELTPLPLGSSKNVEVGDPAVAIGNPFGLDRTLTTGVISALQREITAPNGFAIQDVIQTDAAINPGNSGGPLLDAAGRVIGINSQIETGGGGNGNVGIGFAVPIDTVKRILQDLKTTGTVQRAFLGVTSVTIDGSLAVLDLPTDKGALIQDVTAGSPAATAGLRAGRINAQVNGQSVALGGDVVVQADGKPVTTSEELGQIIGEKDPGDEVAITVLRGGKEETVTVTLGDRPASAQSSQSTG